MAPTCGPGVVGTPVRNTVVPVPIARLVAPAVPVPTAPTAIAHQLKRRADARAGEAALTHKFAVGQTVRFSPDPGEEHAKGGSSKLISEQHRRS